MLIALLGLLRQCARHDRVKIVLQVLLESVQRPRLLVDDGVHQRRYVVAAEGQGSGQHFVEHNADGPQVGTVVHDETFGLFGRHVGGGTEGRSELGDAGRAGKLRQAEVHDLGAAALGDHDVRRLDVAMHDAEVVSLVQAFENLDDQPHGVACRQGLLFHAPAECLALEVGHREEGAALGLAHLIDGADAGVIKRRGGLRLA